MALSFPANPTNGQVYTDTVTGNRYLFNSTANVWSYAANNVGVSVTSTPPSNVAEGSMWWNRDTGRMFVRYNDGTSTQWVETTPSPTLDTNLIASYTNPVYAQANLAFVTANNFANTYNSAYVVANAAFGKANNALQNISGTFAGTLTTTNDVISGGILQTLTTVQSSSGADLSLNANGANRDIIYKVNGTELARLVGSSTNFGVGTATPNTHFEISKAVGAYWSVGAGAYTSRPQAITITNTTNGGYDPVLMFRQADQAGTVKDAGAIGLVGTASWSAADTAQQTSDMYFLVKNASNGISERMRIKSTGQLYMTSGQIQFPATQIASSDANTLDDYEEGTWTPVAAPAGGSLTSYSSSGRYTKIGNMVNIYGLIVLTNVGTAAGSLSISGIPFPTLPGTTYGQIPSLVREQNFTGLVYQLILNNNGSSTGAIFNTTNGAIAWTNNYAYTFQITYATS